MQGKLTKVSSNKPPLLLIAIITISIGMLLASGQVQLINLLNDMTRCLRGVDALGVLLEGLVQAKQRIVDGLFRKSPIILIMVGGFVGPPPSSAGLQWL